MDRYDDELSRQLWLENAKGEPRRDVMDILDEPPNQIDLMREQDRLESWILVSLAGAFLFWVIFQLAGMFEKAGLVLLVLLLVMVGFLLLAIISAFRAQAVKRERKKWIYQQDINSF